MNDNLPAVPTPSSREIAATDTDSWTHVVADVARLAEHIAGTEFVPRQMRNSAPAVAAAILYGREVGLPPMTALTQTHVIEGKPSMSAEAMRALVLAQGHDLSFEEATGAQCIMRARRAGSQDVTRLAWTIDQARAAGLLGKDNWKKYPRAMLIARCTADLCRMVFPDVIHGFRAVEEFDEQLADAEQEPAAPTTKVTRTRKTAAKKSAPAPLEAPKRPAPADGPPLPGEDGYDAPTPRDGAPEQAGEVSGDSTGPGEADATPAVELPQEGNEGEPTTGSSAPGATSTSGDSGRAPDAGSSTTRGNDPVDAAETRPDASTGPSPEQDDKAHPALITRAQQRMLMGQFSSFDMSGDDARPDRLRIVSNIAGREVSSTSDLTKVEATRVIDTLAKVEGPEQLLAIAGGDRS